MMEKNKKLKNSLGSQLFRITIFPLVALTVIVLAVSVSVLYNSNINHVKEEMNRATSVIRLSYEISGKDIRLDEMADIMDMDISLFLEDERVLTTIVDANGNPMVGSKASAVVVSKVLNTGKSAFFPSVRLFDEQAFALYMPLCTESGQVYGMIGVCRESTLVYKAAVRAIWPIVLVCLVTSIIIGIFMFIFGKKTGNRISLMDKFMGILEGGDFSAEVPRELMAYDDELKQLAKKSKSMAKSLQLLVEFDALTELYNRRSGEKRLNEMKKKAENTGNPYCVCIGDIDFFKKVNDTYGHEMGDHVLREVAAKLRLGIHGKGFVARWGGEEFLLVFDGMQLDEAQEALWEILESVRTIFIPDTDKNITMSFGVTEAIESESNDESLKRADANLYTAKETGRNQVIGK